MTEDQKTKLRLEIAHVLFIDIVGYSKLLLNQQTNLLRELNEVVSGTKQFREAESEETLIRLPTGDGMALVFRDNPEAPAQCALEISRALKSHPDIQVRMGVHSGPVHEVADVNQRANIAGAGINIAQRVMDCGDAGHILLSKHVAEDLEQDDYWQPQLHDLGECEVKHGARVHVVNLYTDELGNPAVPEKLAKVVGRRPAKSAATGSGICLRRWIIGILTGTAIVLGGLSFLKHRRELVRSALHHPGDERRGYAVTVPEKSIAVLPFENLSANQENAFFADGVQDEILTNLVKIADLKVISRTSVAQYRNSAARNLREIGKALGVAHLLEGSVQRAENRVRVNAQLVDARNDAHLWAQTYDRDLADVFAIQSEIAKTIADQLQAKLSPKEDAAVREKPTTDVAAYDLYLKALEIERNRASSIGSGGVEGAKQELDLLNQAVSRDRFFVPALCKLCTTHVYLYWINADHTPTRRDMAKKALEEAERLQPDDGEVQITRALFYYWGHRDYARALVQLDLARRSVPNDARIFAFGGYVERRQGKWVEATRDLEQALTLDPRNVVNVAELAAQYFMLRRYTDAAKTLDGALTWKPLDFSLGFLRADVDATWKADLRRWKEVIASGAANTADPKDLITARLTLALKERDYRRAEQILNVENGAELDDNGFFTPRQLNQAIVARGLGDESRATAALLVARQRAAAAVRDQPEDGKALMALAQIDAALGRKDEALQEGEHAVELVPVEQDALIHDALLARLAGVYARAGEANRAFELLDKVTKIPFGVTYGSLKLDEVWDPLRTDPRFEKIVASVAPK
jgi:TolB-like protein/class 3 adenylate cyclase